MTAHNFNQSEFPRINGAQIHHILPAAHQNHPVVQLLLNHSGGRFQLNDRNNAIYLESRTLEGNLSGIHRGFDATHSGYNAAWNSTLNDIARRIDSGRVNDILSGRPGIQDADRIAVINTALELVTEAQDRARAGLVGIDGFGRLVVSNDDAQLRQYAAQNPGRGYDLNTTDGRQRASTDMAREALNIQTEMSPEQRFRIEATKLLYGDAHPLIGLHKDRFYSGGRNDIGGAIGSLSESQRVALARADDLVRQLGLDPKVVFATPETYLRTLIGTAANQGPTSQAADLLRSMRANLGGTAAVGFSAAANILDAGLAAVEISSLLREQRYQEAAVRLGEMAWSLTGEYIGGTAGVVFSTAFVAGIGLGATPVGTGFILLSGLLGANVGSAAFKNAYSVLYTLGVIDADGLAQVLQAAVGQNIGVTQSPDGTLRYQGVVIKADEFDGVRPSPPQPPRCFLPGTPILMADGTHKPIEQIRIGDLVLAFDPATQHGRGALAPSRVTRTFQNTTRTVLDLRGLRMTPGHVCLTAEGSFATIAAILAADGTLVLADGTPIRALTGARLASPEDALLRVAYTDPATGAPRQVTLRAGIPCAARRDADGTLRRYTLAEILAEAGHTALPDGRMRDASGEVFDACDWPAGATPLDRADQRAWIIIGPDGAPYTPDWVQGLEEEAGQEMAIGATTRRITAGPGAARFQPRLVGGTIGAMPTLGSAIGRMH